MGFTASSTPTAFSAPPRADRFVRSVDVGEECLAADARHSATAADVYPKALRGVFSVPAARVASTMLD